MIFTLAQSMEVVLVPCLLAVVGGMGMEQCNPTPASLALIFDPSAPTTSAKDHKKAKKVWHVYVHRR